MWNLVTNLMPAVVCLLLVSASPPGAAAQDGAALLDGPDGLPAVGRVGVAAIGERRFALALGGGYGLTEAQPGEGASHHRGLGSVAASVRLMPELSLGLRLDGRYDRHPADAQGRDDGWAGEPRFVARYVLPLDGGLSLGADLRVMVPGDEAPSVVFGATTADGLLLGSYSLSGGAVTLCVQAGFRLDRTAEAVDGADALRPGDRLALGASDYNAVLIGGGAIYRTGDLLVAGEATADLLIGKDRPPLRRSPIRGVLAVRYGLSSSFALGFSVEGVASELAEPSQALIPIEPRVTVLAGLRYAMSFEEPTVARTDAQSGVRAEAQLGVVRGVVVAGDGTGVAAARLTLSPSASGAAARNVVSGADGRFEVTDLPLGDVRVSVAADGFELGEIVIRASASASEERVTLVRTAPPGQIRGLVRSFGGEPLAATVRVDPLGVERQAAADGTFEIDVPPGEYDVVITSSGYTEQRRHVVVEERGVIVINADLRRAP